MFFLLLLAMGPKGNTPKKVASKASKQSAAEPEEEDYFDFSKYNPFNRIPPKKIWIACGVFSAIWFIILIVAIYAYFKIKGMGKLPYEEPMKTLRRTMAVGLRNPNVAYERYDKVAARVQKIVDHIATAKEDYKDRKKKYLYNYIIAQFGEPFWIGLTDQNMEGDWEWDWSTNKQNFSKGDESMEKDCVFIETSFGQLFYTWKDANCHELKRWACKETLEMEDRKFEQIYFME
ncbi:hypothetical protein JD844_026049 [Phrynosoma platyrhinos]|uniref:C-type lectin domain-containing protein n=1 Tax=Phrynosoma platyrhinos TaxID=52577 RepID=A0ABQ7SED5_PHRPL|nr:hypothetical protein JD844_026049 [Phrynosoma platyrhinos]